MTSIDFEKVINSKPINKLSAIVTQSNGVDNINELTNRFNDLDESIGRLTILLKTNNLSKKEKDKIAKQRRDVRLEKNTLARKYPFLAKKNKLELTPLILEQVKKKLSKEDWEECVRNAKEQLIQNYIEKGLIDPLSDS